MCSEKIPEASPPERNFSFVSSCDLIPASEDSYDYDPDICVHRLHTLLADGNMKELIILTEEKAKRIKIRNIKPPNRNKLIREKIDKVVQHLQDDSRLQEMHTTSHQGRSCQDSVIGVIQNPSEHVHEQKKRSTEKTEHDKILDRLMFAIRYEAEIAVDGGKPTQESISRRIDMKRLLHGCEDTHQYSKDNYSAVIFDAVNTVTGDPDLQVNRQFYDGCQHVSFLLQKQ